MNETYRGPGDGTETFNPSVKEIRELLVEMTDKPWFSWPAHLDERKGYIYWGSDFVADINQAPCESIEGVRERVQYYIDNRMRERA